MARIDGDFIDDGAAACYGAGTYMNVSMSVRTLLPPFGRIVEPISEGLIRLVGLLMVVWGARLVGTTYEV